MTVIQLTSLCSSEFRKNLIKSYQLLTGDTDCVLSSRGDYAGECISLPPRMQAWLKGEGVSRAWRVAGEAVGLRGKAFQSRGGVSLERDTEEFQQVTLKFRYFTCVQVPVPTCRRADGMVGLWRPLRAAGEAEGVKPGTPGKDSKPGKAPLPGP